MRVICESYKKCGNKNCSHAIEHEYSEKCEMVCDSMKEHPKCKSNVLRKKKLDNLKIVESIEWK